MFIQDFAKKFHVSPDTVRYYEKEGLLLPKRLQNQYRVFDAACERTMKFILVFKELGFSLTEIKDVLFLENQPISQACNETTSDLFQHKIHSLNNTIAFFTKAMQVLQASYDLMADGNYRANKSEIEDMLLAMYEELPERRKGHE